MEIPFIGGAYEGRSTWWNAQRSINCFPIYDDKQAKVPVAMVGTPGSTTFADIGSEVEIRGMIKMGGTLYVVAGNRMYSVASDGTVTEIDNSNTLGTSTGYVGMSANDDEVLIVDGTSTAKLVTSSTVTDLTSGSHNLTSSVDCTIFDGTFITVRTDTGQFQISDPFDGLTWSIDSWATAEGSPDDLVGISSTKQNVWFFGKNTVEVYFNSGNVTMPFERVPGAVNDIGCAARGSIVAAKGVIFWLTDKNTVARSDGYGYKEISTETLNYTISQYSTISDARGFWYELDGNMFYVLNFPTEAKTWAVDAKTGDWHEWQTGDTQFKGICSIDVYGKMLVGGRSDGIIYELDLGTYTDGGNAIKRVRRTQIISKEDVNVIHHRIALDFEFGVGLDVSSTTAGYDPEADLRWSDDGGNSWSTTRSVKMGKYQVYNKRAVWRTLGKSRYRIYELTVDEPVKFVLMGAFSNLEACKV